MLCIKVPSNLALNIFKKIKTQGNRICNLDGLQFYIQWIHPDVGNVAGGQIAIVNPRKHFLPLSLT